MIRIYINICLICTHCILTVLSNCGKMTHTDDRIVFLSPIIDKLLLLCRILLQISTICASVLYAEYVIVNLLNGGILLEARELLIDQMTANLPVLRKKLKLSQEDLAGLIGTSRHTIASIETGKRKMTWNTFLSLILLFDKNEETAVLLRALQIYTDDFDNTIRQKSSTSNTYEGRV